MKDKNGFTLVELIIVMAVLGILAAVLIPTFGGITASSKEKVCAYNRGMLKKKMDEDMILLSLDKTEENVTSVWEKDKDEASCPGKGNLSLEFKEGEYIIKCSEHTGGSYGELAETSAVTIKSAVASVLESGSNDNKLKLSGGYSSIDSTAPDADGARRIIVESALGASISTAWKITKDEDKYEYYVLDRVSNSQMKVNWWTYATKIDSEGNVLHGFVKSRWRQGDNSYRIIDSASFTTDPSLIPEGRLYP